MLTNDANINSNGVGVMGGLGVGGGVLIRWDNNVSSGEAQRTLSGLE